MTLRLLIFNLEIYVFIIEVVCAENDPLPGILGLRIVGDAVLSGRLTACGHSINGTSLCIFQVFQTSHRCSIVKIMDPFTCFKIE